MAPELAKVELKMRDKLNGTSSDNRGYGVALASFRKWKKDHAQVEYGQKVDVYAFAITMFEILSHQPPWQDAVDEGEDVTKSVLYQVVNGKRPQAKVSAAAGAPPGWIQLMEECWSESPDARPGFTRVRAVLAEMLEPLLEAEPAAVPKIVERKRSQTSWGVTQRGAAKDTEREMNVVTSERRSTTGTAPFLQDAARPLLELFPQDPAAEVGGYERISIHM